MPDQDGFLDFWIFRNVYNYRKLLFSLDQLGELAAGVGDLRWSRFGVHRHDGTELLNDREELMRILLTAVLHMSSSPTGDAL